MLQLFVNGQPGVGKTTLCRLLCDELGLELIATGDLLRENIVQKTPLGLIAKDCISRKSLVPDHVVVDMVAEKICAACLSSSDKAVAKGWVLDGFPRTSEQSAALRRKHIFPSVVVVLELNESECVKRITGRRFDPLTSKIYHMPNIMPRDTAVLSRLTKRSDDAADKLAPRFEAYRLHSDATNATYSGIAHRVDASRKTPQEVLEAVLQLLHSVRPQGGSNKSLTNTTTDTSTRGNQPLAGSLQRQTPPVSHVMAHSSKRLHQVPQRIEEEDEEQVASEVQAPEVNYDSDDNTPRARRAPFGAALSTAARPTQQPSAFSIPSDGLNSTESFEALHVELGKQFDAQTASASKAEEPTLIMGSDNNEDPSTAIPVAASPIELRAVPAAAPPTVVHGVDMIKFKDMLLDGFDVLKHGRRGSPHARTIFTDMEFKRIFWMKPGKEAKAKKAKLDQSLLLVDVVQVVRGMKTEVLKRSGDVSKYERYLSLVADDRTLDLELPSEAMCEFLLRGFEQLLHGSS